MPSGFVTVSVYRIEITGTPHVTFSMLVGRGGVEDTKIEAKDTKKFRGQGQTLSRPRPRTQTQVFSKKKVLKNFFQAISKKSLQKFFFR